MHANSISGLSKQIKFEIKHQNQFGFGISAVRNLCAFQRALKAKATKWFRRFLIPTFGFQTLELEIPPYGTCQRRQFLIIINFWFAVDFSLSKFV